MERNKPFLLSESKNEGPLSSEVFHRYTVSQAVNYFVKSLPKANNYGRIARKYLDYCLEHGFLIDAFSEQAYCADQWPSIRSAVRKFVRFALEHNIRQVVADPVERKVSPAANELILGFIRDAVHLRGDHSKDTYVKALNVFFAWMQQHGESFSMHAVSAFMQDLLREHRSAFTVNLYLTVIKQLVKWIIRKRRNLDYAFTEQQIDALREVSDIKLLPVDEGFYKDALTEAEREQLQNSITDIHWQAVVALMSYCGLRSVEVTRLRIKDINLEKRQVFVKGKGKHTYVPVKLFARAVIPLSSWLQQRQQDKPAGTAGTSPLFPQLTARRLQYHVRKLLQQAGLAREKLSTHSLRHTAAQVLISKNAEPVHVQRQLRHKSFDTTYLYVRKAMEEDFMKKLPDES